jgi:lysophospholipase L1-like esterase
MRAIAALLAAALAGCATVPASGPALPPGAHYVATGSSFAAGAGLPRLKDDAPARCGRTETNYATLLARRLQLMLDDQTCGGATTAHLLGPWNELPAQLDAVRPDTALVTVTIGGNDLGYAAYLMTAGCPPGGTFEYQGRVVPCPQGRVPTEADYVRLEANLRAIVRRVKSVAPQARVVFVQYVRLVPDQLCDAARLQPDKAGIAAQTGRRLAEVTARVAQIEGAEVLPADVLSANHTACDAYAWSQGTKGVPGDGVAWHPTTRAHAEIAEALARMLR